MVNPLPTTIYSEFWTWVDPPSESRTESSSIVSNPTSIPQKACSAATTKKKHGPRGSRGDDGDSHQSRRRRLMKEHKEPDAFLACPFAKHNPIICHDCWDFAAENLARLKEHLLRRHERPYCPVCLGKFDNYDARDIHVRGRTCHKVDGGQRGAWMEPEAVRKIRRRTKKGEDALQGWQRIYSIIFPHEKTIPSPYREDIAQLCMERIRKTTIDEFIRHVHSTLDTLSTNASTNELSMIKSACVSHLSKVADQYITRESSRNIEPTAATALNLSGRSLCSTASFPVEEEHLLPSSSGRSSPDPFECFVDIGAVFHPQENSLQTLANNYDYSEPWCNSTLINTLMDGPWHPLRLEHSTNIDPVPGWHHHPLDLSSCIAPST